MGKEPLELPDDSPKAYKMLTEKAAAEASTNVIFIKRTDVQVFIAN